MSWAAEELKTANLGDKRRNRRLIKIVEDLSAMPHASVTQAARDEAAVQGTYEFWGNVRVKASDILAAHLVIYLVSKSNQTSNWLSVSLTGLDLEAIGFALLARAIASLKSSK